jgi:hypothetical protein
MALTTAAYDNRILPAGTLDPDRLAVLADALEDAGCDNGDILAHLRGPTCSSTSWVTSSASASLPNMRRARLNTRPACSRNTISAVTSPHGGPGSSWGAGGAAAAERRERSVKGELSGLSSSPTPPVNGSSERSSGETRIMSGGRCGEQTGDRGQRARRNKENTGLGGVVMVVHPTEAVCSNRQASTRARRPCAGLTLGRWVSCLAARAHRPLSLGAIL